MGERIEVSVVIPAFNAEGLLGQQLRALARQQGAGAFEVIVADNGSTDRTREVAESYMAEVSALRVIDASQRRGPGYARNVGAATARGDLLLFCDADDVAGELWVATMAEQLRKTDGVGGHLETSSINAPRIHRLRPSPTAFGLPAAFGRWPVPLGASSGIRRRCFEELGGFDEAFSTPAGEETDLFIRLQLSGGSVGWAAGAVMHYRLRPGLRAMWRQARTYGAANAALRRRLASEGVPPFGLRELLGHLPWLSKCALFAPFSPPHRGQLVWWTGHTVGLVTAGRRQ